MRRRVHESKQNELIKYRRRKRMIRRARKIKKIGSLIHHSQSVGTSKVWPHRMDVPVPKKGRVDVRVPKVFSFIENADETMGFIDQLEGVVAEKKLRHLEIDHSRCEQLDLCASLVMDTIIDRARRSRRFALSGWFSEDERVNIMLRASGLLDRIGHPSSVLPAEIEAVVRKSQLFYGSSRHSERTSRCDRAATGLTDYFGTCLQQAGGTLSRIAQNRLSTLISEAISNAEEHARGKWFAKAHFDRLRPNEQEGGSCHIVLFNVSEATIYNSFNSPGASPETFTRMQAYTRRHLGKGFFQKPYDEEALCTLYALQEGVSSLPEHRGTGTTSLIDFFMQLAGKNPRMCVLSGRARILFDGRFQLKAEHFEGGPRQVIAFNERNSLENPPDREYVRTLATPFPGTLISMKFNLKEKYTSDV